jgi:two-component system sensor histidine kinase CiaH
VKLPHPSLIRLRRSAAGPAGSPATRAASSATEEDARILRRTRLRLMAVSGFVTLTILVVLGVAVYGIVSTAVVNAATDQLERATVLRHDADALQGPTFEGAAAGLIPIPIGTDGKPIVVPRLPRIPPGLPSAASLAAVTDPTATDVREVVATDGTPYRVISFYAAAGNKVQWAQNRTGEVNFLNTLAGVMLGGGLLALLAALGAGYVYAGRALVPIRDSINRRQAALQRQREFTANASHELRTPLTVIRTSIEDLRRNRRSRVEDVGEALDDIEAEVRTVTALVEDMLLLARTDSGVIELERVPLDLADVAMESTSLLASLGTERGVAVLVEPLPAAIVGDEMRLRQLVTILVDNAIRHSPSGSTVEVRVRSETGLALLEVEDHGPGIKPEDLPRLWERFWRADNAPAGGTGLGLAIAKWIVEQHGGTIGATNCDAGGAMFWVRLPAPGAHALGAIGGDAGEIEAEIEAAPDGGPAAPGSPQWSPGDSSHIGS